MMQAQPIESEPLLYGEEPMGLRFGRGSVPLVCLHGFGGDPRDFEYLAHHLDARLSLYALDLLPSSDAELHIDPFDSLFQRIESLKLDAFFLFGYSMGGRVALKLALERAMNLSGLILVSTTGGYRNGVEYETRRKFEALIEHQIQSLGNVGFQDWWSQLPIIKTQSRMPNEFRLPMHARRTQQPIQKLSRVNHCFGTSRMQPMWTTLNTLEHKTLCLVGELDEKYLALGQTLVQAVPNAEMKIIENVGHAPHLEDPVRTAQHLQQFCL